MKNTKRIIALALGTILIAQCFCGCKRREDPKKTDIVSQEDISSAKAPVNLKNHMSDAEKASVTKGPLSVLDEPWKKEKKDSEYAEGVFVELWTKEDILRDIEENPDYYSAWTQEEIEDYKSNFLPYIAGYTVDGRNYGLMIVPGMGLCEDESYGCYYTQGEDGLEYHEIKDMEELKTILPDLMKEYQKKDYQYNYISDSFDPDTMEKDVLRVFEAVKAGQYEKLPINTTHTCFETMLKEQDDQDFAWELDRDAVAAIKDQVTEYHMHDDELDRDFVIHVALPKNYDAEKALPALVLTDAVWRFNDIAKLLCEMEEGRANPQILISIGQDYSISNSDNIERAAVFCEGKDKFLDFITDNLMPYLGEIYLIDNENSTLFGHSLGGVFSHYALFNSDRYENQPFGNYIVGSPAFWSPYSRDMSDYKEQADDYGYFERNQTINKHVFITAGSDEDEDYAEYFEDGDSTTESIAHLADRINAHCSEGSPMAKDKLYKSHHYQYIPDMLIEYADGEF